MLYYTECRCTECQGATLNPARKCQTRVEMTGTNKQTLAFKISVIITTINVLQYKHQEKQ
jgi:hypothetical protein